MRVLVTGAGGFIGSHLTERLIADGNDVMAMAHICGRDTFGWLDGIVDCERVRGDVRDPEQMRHLIRAQDRVYHLAALGSVPYSFEAPRSFIQTNVEGTLNVALACAEYGVELIHTSTSEVYGTAQTEYQDENHPICPQSPYAASKAAADYVVKAISLSRGLKAVILRPFNTYGPRQSARAVIAKIIIGVMSGDTLSLGSLTPKRDWLYVEDTVSAFLTVQPTESCRTYNAGTGFCASVGDVLDLVQNISGFGVYHMVDDEDRLRPNSAEVWSLRAGCDALRSLGWEPKVSMIGGLTRTIAWYTKKPMLGRFIDEVV